MEESGLHLEPQLHCANAIRDSILSILQTDRQGGKIFAEQFLKRFSLEKVEFGNNLKCKEVIIKASIWLCENLYETHRDCPKERNYPYSCDYEAFIPFNQPESKYIQFMVVPAGAKAGDKVVVVSDVILGPFITPFLQSVLKTVNPEVRQGAFLYDYPMKKPSAWQISKMIDAFTKAHALYSEEIGEAKVGYSVERVVEEPRIRLRCYNIPLQCVYEMAYFHLSSQLDEVSAFSLTQGQGESRAKKQVPHSDMVRQMLMWTIWNMAGLSKAERLEVLLRAAGMKSTAAAAMGVAMIRKIDRIFHDHLLRKQAGWKDKIQSVN